jgi:7-carboxy-7-deazaguanine synthase
MEMSNLVTDESSSSEAKAAAGLLPVMEIFGPTVQGEGHLVGVPTHFIRLGGCPYRCKWCDSMHAVDPDEVSKNAKWMTPHQIMWELTSLANNGLTPQWVTISGGDPVIWDCYRLVDYAVGVFQVAVETEGFMFRPWLHQVDLVTLSPKPPSSGMLHKLNWEVLKEYTTRIARPNLVLKVVVFDSDDLEFASMVRGKFPKTQFYLSVGTGPNEGREAILDRYKWLVEAALKNPNFTEVRVFPQMHVLAWGHERGK